MKQVAIVKRVFKLNLLILQLLGFYPTKTFSKLYTVYAYAIYIFCTIPVPVLAAVNLIIGENIDSEKVRDSLFIIFQAGTFIFKVVPFIFNAKEVRRTIYMMDFHIFNQSNNSYEEIIQDCENVCKRNTRIFLGFCGVACAAWAITPFFGSVYKFPIEIWLPFDATCSVKVYVATYIFIAIGICNGAISNGAIDPLVSGMVYFAVSQIRILKNNLTHLSSDAELSLNLNQARNVSLKIMYDQIRNCINHHTAILDFVKLYEKVCSSVVFAQFMAAGTVICVSCWQLSMIETFTFQFFTVISLIFTMILEIVFYCDFGSSLFEESNSLTTAVYMSVWYEYDLKCQKALLILMERSKKPIVITAGKIWDLSLVTFTTILRRAYSLLAMLKNY